VIGECMLSTPGFSKYLQVFSPLRIFLYYFNNIAALYSVRCTKPHSCSGRTFHILRNPVQFV